MVSAAEKQRRYRARRDADPERREQCLKKQREAWHRMKAQGKVKAVADMSDKEKRGKRVYWKMAKKKSRERQKKIKESDAPPGNPGVQPQVSRQKNALGLTGRMAVYPPS